MVQETIFDHIARQRHSSTSTAAAEQIRPHAKTLRERVLRFIEGAGPVTDEEICIRLGLNPSTGRPRRVELLRAGLICEAGEAETHSGRKAKLWKVVT